MQHGSKTNLPDLTSYQIAIPNTLLFRNSSQKLKSNITFQESIPRHCPTPSQNRSSHPPIISLLAPVLLYCNTITFKTIIALLPVCAILLNHNLINSQ